MTRALSALLLALGLLFTTACSESQSGDSVTDNLVDRDPAVDEEPLDEDGIVGDD